MVDSRIYRAGLALVAVAVIVFAFSLTDQPAAAPSNLAPSAVSGKTPYGTMLALAKAFPRRSPGSPADQRLSSYVAAQLRGNRGYTVTSSTAEAQTADGERPVTTVTATRTGLAAGALVVVSHRDGTGDASLSGTAVLLDLAHVLSGQSESHTVVLISTSGAVGQAGAMHVSQMLASQPVDAVIVLGDLAAAQPSEPLVSPWSDTDLLAPALVDRTLAKYLSSAAGLSAGNVNLAAQFAHLAFPLTVTDQGPYAAAGIPATLLSLSGYRLPTGAGPVSAAHLQGTENALLQTLNALDNAPRVPPPSAYLLLSGKVVPGWAVSLLVLALIVPVAVATLDALARVRRRGHSMLRWLGWILASAVPFGLALAVLLVVRFAGVLPATPPGPLAGGVALTGAGIAVLAVLALVLVGGFVYARPRITRRVALLGSPALGERRPAGDAAAVALLVVMCLLSLALWVADPFTVALLLPALHLWLWLAQPGVRTRRPAMLALAVAGLAPCVLLGVYYAHSLDLSPLAVVWDGVLLVAGGWLSVPAAVAGCVLLGCVVSVLVIAWRAAVPAPTPAETAITVRGPVTYAGPGSLGGTESALGSRR